MIGKKRTRTLALVAVALLAALSLIGATTSADTTPPQNPSPAVVEGLAAPSMFLSYQGRLLGPDGNPVPDSSYSVAFAIFDDAVAGSKLWTETRDVTVSKGLFSVLLGQVNSLDTVFDGRPLWLAVNVARDGEVVPRIPIAYVPYAFRAANAANAEMLGGSLPSSYRDATNLTAGTLSPARYSAVKDLELEDYLGNAAGDIALNNTIVQTNLNADMLDGQHSTNFATAYVDVTGDTMNGTLNVSVPAGGSDGVSSSTASTLGGAAAVEARNTGAGYGLNAYSAANSAVYAVAAGANPAIYASNSNTIGHSILSLSSSTTSGNAAVAGWAQGNSGTVIGIKGQCNFSTNASCFGGYFIGPVYVSGLLTKAGGGFKIDHPLDPQNKVLNHSFVESPDMMNVYNGNIVLDAEGKAWVELPAWFQALNRDFRYQLTAIGGPGPNLYIAQKIQDNRFQIAGGTPGLEVSWQVTGIRQDPFADAHRIPVEEDKPADQKGTYLNPDVYGQPESLGANQETPISLAPAAGSAAEPDKP